MYKQLISVLLCAVTVVAAYGGPKDAYSERYRGGERGDVAAMLASDTVSGDEKDALRWLYAYMPLPDIADHDASFYLANIRSSLRAAREMPWGGSVPAREWRHFVLPVRVNNEDLDLSRPAMYEELKNRVKGLSMGEAILEVNHWCHEKATYRPSDARTNSPFATMRSALGRCGEESTFTVAALRAVGIPARQVYTPRWAHTDDNHAWVEAWADGKWHFLGACEPEPVLDLGWFNAPASRGMLMTTKVFGAYDGPEEQLEQTNTNTLINVTSNYAPTAAIDVRVYDADGRPAKGARVDFCLYNYAEFFPVATKVADEEGCASLVAGMGHMVVWASDGKGYYGLSKVSAGEDNKVQLTVDGRGRWRASFDIVPPSASGLLPAVTDAQRAENECRKAAEDSIRTAYTSTFCGDGCAATLATELGLPADRVARVMRHARGNHEVVSGFLRSVQPSEREKALTMLEQLAEKDLNDVTAEVLADHLATPPYATALYDAYILNPRVEREMLTPYKAFLGVRLDKTMAAQPERWVQWVADSICLDEAWNPLGFRMSPQAVWRERKADALSRSIFFVAGARSLGVAARIDPVSGKTQYSPDGESWVDVDFGASAQTAAPVGFARLECPPRSGVEPRYYSHFTLSKIENGRPVLQNYDEMAPLSQFVSSPMPLDTGNYVLLTGQRLADGAVLVHGECFSVAEGDTVSVPFILRQDDSAVQVAGNFNSENLYYDAATGTARSLLSTTGRGYYTLVLVAPGHEPSAHAINDIAARARDFEADGRKIMLVFPDKASLGRFDASLHRQLPSNIVLGADIDGAIASELCSALELPAGQLPVVVIADTFNRVVFVRQGYSVGLADALLQTLSRVGD